MPRGDDGRPVVTRTPPTQPPRPTRISNAFSCDSGTRAALAASGVAAERAAAKNVVSAPSAASMSSHGPAS